MKDPWPKETVLKILLMIWSLPTLILAFLFVILPLATFKQIKLPCKWNIGAFECFLLEGCYLEKKCAHAAFSVGWFIVYKEQYKNNMTIAIHERQHLKQQYVLSVFQWMFYGLFSAIIWIACPNLHAYKANPFELDAMREAGQDTNEIGPIHGDRWPWW